MNHTVMYQFKTTREEPQLTSNNRGPNMEPGLGFTPMVLRRGMKEGE